jgi:hypothetical protein
LALRHALPLALSLTVVFAGAPCVVFAVLFLASAIANRRANHR